MLRGVWQALNCLFIHATFCVTVTEASPGQTKKQEAQLSQRDRAMLHVIEDLVKSLKVIRNDTVA